ncbi:unnamed protein product [Rotaria sp. Silwood1]|nr:unnamed protein product [Rotaria sp. Silwood1]CAF4757576.1 unnamed protein product [Rotaria sp. Silwood1]CAF4806530.1 unnamed protein product [Rotaria sp. Silwood1]CAF4924820.1 unnamed protein product [Rotaria sp. Silwood1]
MARANPNSTSTIKKPYHNLFDMIDETNDGLQFSKDTLNQYFLSGQLPSITYTEEFVDDTVLHAFEHNELIEQEQDDQDDDETILSQKLSQLSTTGHAEVYPSATMDKKRRSSSRPSPAVCSKRMKISDYNADDDDDDDSLNVDDIQQNHIPNYLSMNSTIFVRLCKNLLKTVPTMTMNDLQQLALLMHQIAALRIKEEMSHIYLKSVTGTLTEPECDLIEVDRRVWPMQVQALVLSKRPFSSVATTEMNQAEQQTTCERLLQDRILELNEHMQQYQQQLNEKKKSFKGFTSMMDETLQHYVQEYGVQPLQVKYEMRKSIVTHDFESEILERKYLQENPNEYQLEIAKHLLELRRDVEKSKRALLELKQGVFFNKSSLSFQSIQASISTSMDTTMNNNKMPPSLLNTDEKRLRYQKLDLLAIHIPEAELTYYRFQHLFDVELARMWQNHRTLVKNQGMTTALTHLLEQRLTQMTNRWRDIFNYRIDYFLRYSYDELDYLNNNHGHEQTMKITTASSALILDTTHPFTHEQLQLLSRGPSYVPPCLMYVLFSNESIDDIVKKQFAPFNHQLMTLLEKHKINLAVRMEIQDTIFKEFKNCFSKSIPSSLSQRALYEKSLIQSIHSAFKKHHLILRRTADNMNTFYIGNRQDFEAKADQYLTRSEDYRVLININAENNDKPLDVALKDMIDSMNTLVEQLKTHKAIKDDLYKRFIADVTKTKLPYLYFLPNISKESGISLVPIITSHQSATWKIAKYLNQLLQPFVDKILHSTTFADETDFIRKFYHYANTERRLRPTTLFCSIKITNFYALDEHQHMIDVIGYCLQDNLVTNRLEPLSIQTIRNLLYLFLYNNIFRYKDNIYAFTKGGPNTMPLTTTLSNIYLFVWQKKLLKEIDQNIEFFGRHNDQLFFTWNKSNALQLETFLQDIREKHLNVRFQKLIGSSVQFMNAYLENRQGQLYSRVHYDPNIPRYTLPYVIGHSKSAYSDWLQSALIRAVCYCTSVEDFQQERTYLELTLLINGYSLLFVETHVKHFFNHFHAQTLRFSRSQSAYDNFRQQWFTFVEQRQELTQELQKFDQNDRLIQFNYIHDFGPRCRFNREFYQLWFHYFQQHPKLSQEKCKIILQAKHFHSLNSLLTIEPPSPPVQQ